MSCFAQTHNFPRAILAAAHTLPAIDSYQHAVKLMNQADAYATEKDVPRKHLIAAAREAVQTAEDARAIAVKKIDEQRESSERQASSDAKDEAQAQTADANRQKEQAQSDTARAQSTATAFLTDRFRGYFGPQHQFGIYNQPFLVVGGYPRFQYNGYWISLVDPWPQSWTNNWYDTDDVYVTYADNGYYLHSRRHPTVGLAISIAL